MNSDFLIGYMAALRKVREESQRRMTSHLSSAPWEFMYWRTHELEAEAISAPGCFTSDRDPGVIARGVAPAARRDLALELDVVARAWFRKGPAFSRRVGRVGAEIDTVYLEEARDPDLIDYFLVRLLASVADAMDSKTGKIRDETREVCRSIRDLVSLSRTHEKERVIVGEACPNCGFPGWDGDACSRCSATRFEE